LFISGFSNALIEAGVIIVFFVLTVFAMTFSFYIGRKKLEVIELKIFWWFGVASFVFYVLFALFLIILKFLP